MWSESMPIGHVGQYDVYLAHHGVKGQRWGVRRYQNKDGSYTNAGKKRYQDMSPSEKREYTRKRNLRNQRIKTGLLVGGTVALLAASIYAANKAGSGYNGSSYNSDYYRQARERWERANQYSRSYEEASRKARQQWEAGRKATEEAFKRNRNTAYKQAVKMTPAQAKENLHRVMREAAKMEANGGMDIAMKERVMQARDMYKAAKQAAGQ